MTTEMRSIQRFGPGNVNCGGCGMGVALKHALEELGSDTILAIPACCAAVSVGAFPTAAVHVPVLLHAFETTGATIAGIRAALEVRGLEGTNVVGWAGDGGTYDIGLQAMSGAAERGDDAIYVCYDNEAYMNTGVQRSSSTPAGAWTTTTPEGKPEGQPKKDIVAILAAHQIPYLATASIAYPDDLRAKVRRARDTRGFRFLLIQSPCPTGWRYDSKDSIHIARLGVMAGLFPLLEVEKGVSWTLSIEPTFEGLDEYLELQGRFGKLDDEHLAVIQNDIDTRWRELRRRLEPAA
ncbi:MAG: thiamine pyrophosphate-dependent enzyme [Acidobacteriota bacterium]|nr:thiamine pyrophosphate-dependent enzyme [Acidobacteriota bacterium]